MNIVLDSNIIRRDFQMSSNHFRVLFDYAEKTNSRILIPQVVYDEVLSLFQREYKKRTELISCSKESVERIIGSSIKLDLPSPDKALEGYKQHLFSKLGIPKKNIAPFCDSFLSEAIKRSIERIKPCSERGEEFRDVIIWLSILDYAEKYKDKDLILISNNTKEFSDNGENELDPHLLEEAAKRKIDVKYYRSVEDFTRKHADKIAFITEEWLASEMASLNLDDDVERAFKDEKMSSRYREREYTGVETLGDSVMIENFFVHEMTDETIEVELNCCCDIEVEYEEDTVEREYDPIDGCSFPVHLRNHGYLTSTASVEVWLKIEKKEVVEIPSISVSFSYNLD